MNHTMHRLTRILVVLSFLVLTVPVVSAQTGSGTVLDPFIVTTIPTVISRSVEVQPLTHAPGGCGPTFTAPDIALVFTAQFTVPPERFVDGIFTIDTGGSDFDTVIEIRDSDNQRILTVVPICSDDFDQGGIGFASQVTAGQFSPGVYRVMVWSYDGTPGSMVLAITDRQLVSAVLTTTIAEGTSIGGTYSCHPATGVPPVVSATIDGKPVGAYGDPRGCGHPDLRWFTDIVPKNSKSYQVEATLTVQSPPFPAGGTATVTGKVKAKAK